MYPLKYSLRLDLDPPESRFHFPLFDSLFYF